MKIGNGMFGTIYAGNTRTDKNGREMWTKKTDVTDQCIKAVFQWFMDKSKAEDNKEFQVSFPGFGVLTYDPNGILEKHREKVILGPDDLCPKCGVMPCGDFCFNCGVKFEWTEKERKADDSNTPPEEGGGWDFIVKSVEESDFTGYRDSEGLLWLIGGYDEVTKCVHVIARPSDDTAITGYICYHDACRYLQTEIATVHVYNQRVVPR
jgi:hypothetical protein